MTDRVAEGSIFDCDISAGLASRPSAGIM